MHRFRFLIILLLGFGVAGALWMVAPVQSQEQMSAVEKIERGRYLATVVGGCAHCHSPKVFTEHGPEPDPERFLAGTPAGTPVPPVPEGVLGPPSWGAMCSPDMTVWVGPWGVSFASNLTSDEKTGLGAWTDEQFIKAMRTGKHRGFGRQILPPMPWADLGRMSDDDLSAMLAFFKSVKAIDNKVPDPLPPAGK